MKMPSDRAIAWLEKWCPREGQMHAPGAENWNTIVSMWEWDLKWGEGDKDRMTMLMLRALAKWSKQSTNLHVNADGSCFVATRTSDHDGFGRLGDSEFEAALAAVEAAAEMEDGDAK